MTDVRIELDDDEYEHLRRVKDWNGVTWKEVLRVGVEHLDSPAAEQ